jgi:hypothetical protein
MGNSSNGYGYSFFDNLPYESIVSEVKKYEQLKQDGTYAASSFFANPEIETTSTIMNFEEATELAYSSWFLENYTYSSGGVNPSQRSKNVKISHGVFVLHKGLHMMNAMNLCSKGSSLSEVKVSFAENNGEQMVEKYNWTFTKSRIVRVQDIPNTSYYMVILAMGTTAGEFTAYDIDGEDSGNSAFAYDATLGSEE